MNGYSNRSTAAALRSLVLLAAAALAGCATTGGGTRAAMGNAVRPLAADVTTPTGYVVCSGATASRFPQREAAGRTCRSSPSLRHAIY